MVPNVEEFGIAAVEAQASGRPVIAAEGGGALETTIPGETSVLVPLGDVDALADAMRTTDFDRFSRDRIRRTPPSSRPASSSAGSWPRSAA